MINLEKDKAIAMAATDGPWDFGYYNVCSKEDAMELAGLNYDNTKNAAGVRPQGFGAFVSGTDIKTADSGYSGGKSEENARYIAHFNPSKITEYHDHIEAQDKRIDELGGMLEVSACPNSCTNGAVYRIPTDEYEQCQFCYEREQLLPNQTKDGE